MDGSLLFCQLNFGFSIFVYSIQCNQLERNNWYSKLTSTVREWHYTRSSGERPQLTELMNEFVSLDL